MTQHLPALNCRCSTPRTFKLETPCAGSSGSAAALSSPSRLDASRVAQSVPAAWIVEMLEVKAPTAICLGKVEGVSQAGQKEQMRCFAELKYAPAASTAP